MRGSGPLGPTALWLGTLSEMLKQHLPRLSDAG